jgi:hypothetical protein
VPSGTKREQLTIGEAERRFPCRIKLGIPPRGFGMQLAEIGTWLDENCGADGWDMTPAGLRGVVNDAVAIHFLDPASAAAFVSRRCARSKVDQRGGISGAQGSANHARSPRPHKTF